MVQQTLGEPVGPSEAGRREGQTPLVLGASRPRMRNVSYVQRSLRARGGLCVGGEWGQLWGHVGEEWGPGAWGRGWGKKMRPILGVWGWKAPWRSGNLLKVAHPSTPGFHGPSPDGPAAAGGRSRAGRSSPC